MSEIFLSYCRKDEAAANKLKSRFKRFGYDVWLDRDDIIGGHLWRSQIVEGIENCLLYVILLSKHSIASDNVRRELDLARANRKPILPITMKHDHGKVSKDMQYQLVGLQQLDYADMFKRGAKRLIDDLTPPPKTVHMATVQGGLVSRLEHASGDCINLIKKQYVIGRGAEADVDLTKWDSNRHVSKQHAKLFFSNGVWKIRRYSNASNPTFVNDNQIQKESDAILKDGNEIIFADVHFQFISGKFGA